MTTPMPPDFISGEEVLLLLVILQFVEILRLMVRNSELRRRLETRD